MKWIALFSRTGSEIANLSEAIGRWPDVIYTTRNPADWDERLKALPSSKIFFFPHAQIMTYLREMDRALVTLHGYLRIIPEDVTLVHNMYNGHPGDIITSDELRGMDPQEKAFQLGHKTVGCVLHKVDGLVDNGEIVSYNIGIPVNENNLDDYYNKLADAQLDLWINFMTEETNKAVQPKHYKGVNINGVEVTTIDVIERLYDITMNDGFTDYNRFQAFKYIWRAGLKDPVLQDLKKARQFLNFAIEALEKKNETK